MGGDPTPRPGELDAREADPGYAGMAGSLDLLSRLHAAVYVAEAGEYGRWIYVSPQVEQLIGFTPDEMIADAGLWASRLHPEDRERVLADEEAARRGAVLPGYSEYRMIRKDGRVVWVLDDMTTLLGPGHGPLHHGLLYDVTPRKKAELMLAEHVRIVERVARGDDLTETLADLAGATQVATGATSCVVVVESAFVPGGQLAVSASGRILPGALTADADRIVPFHGADGDRLGRLLVRYTGQTGTAAGIRARPADEDEALTWMAHLAAMAVSRAAQDAQMVTSLSLLEATLESTADGILVVDGRARIVGYNQRFREMWRIPQQVLDDRDDNEAIGYVLAQLAEPDRFLAEVDRLYGSPEESSFDVLHFRDGRVFERYSQPQRVGGRSVGRVWSFRDVTSYRVLESRLRHQAHMDPLTPLPNRALFMERLTDALDVLASPEPGRSARDRTVAVLLLDVDDFKTVNDGLGHSAGDQLLVGIAERLARSLRAGDVGARLGGDEFVVLIQDVRDDVQVTSLATRLLAELARPLDLDGHSVSVRASIGIALADAGMHARDLLRNADLAMYTVKRLGGGGYRMFHPDMHAEAVSRLELSGDLARAIDRGELRLEFQPLVALDTLRVVGVEALARWDHGTRGSVSPEEFVPLAEETGLVDRIGRWVLEQACEAAAGWPFGLVSSGHLRLSVNVSPRQLVNPRFVADVGAILDAAGLPPTSLVLEITESALALSTVDAVRVLTELKELGLGLALDDFGTSYSSLGRLGEYPLDVVKVDKSFIDPLGSGNGDSALVEAILALAEALGLGVVAEGIETERQLHALRSLGCAQGQGYLFSEPVSNERLAAVLASAELDPWRPDPQRADARPPVSQRG